MYICLVVPAFTAIRSPPASVWDGNFFFYRCTVFASFNVESFPSGGAHYILVIHREMINQLAPWCSVLNEKLIVTHLAKKISAFMVIEYSLLRSQRSANGPCNEHDQSDPPLNTLFLRA
jgi:hypothetical protein